MQGTDDRSASQVLMDALSDFTSSEGQSVILVYTNDQEDVVVKSNCRRPEAIGLIEIAKHMIMNSHEHEDA